MERETNVKTCLKEWHKHPFSWLIVLFGMGYGVFYVMVRYLFRANGIGVIFVSIILGILLVLVNWLLWKSVAFHFCPKKDTALDALDILALYKAWGMHVLLYMIWFIPVWPALLIIFSWYWGWQHKYNVRLGCTCPKCGEISLKSLSDAESDPLLYESDCTELEKGIADIRYYRCSSCGKLLKHRIHPAPCLMELNVNRNNKALHFYEKMGMRKLREGDFPIGNGYYMNDYIMGLNI